jgi:hypothetical protein
MNQKLNFMYFDGPCPFLLCLKKEPHLHPICPECRSVRYSNQLCKTCREYNAKHPDRTEI